MTKKTVKKPPTPPRVKSAREIAFGLLLKLDGSYIHADALLRTKAVERLCPADQNLVTTLVMGCLRWAGSLDAAFRPLLKKPNARLDAEVLVALRMATFQMLYLDRIPAHAAIDASVELTKLSGHKFASGLVNAVLRKVAALPKAKPEEAILAATSAQELAQAAAHPAWMVERWCARYGIDAAREICRSGQQAPATSLRFVADEVEKELGSAGIQIEPGEMLAAARTLLHGDLAETDASKTGRVRIQDEGSQLIAELAACCTAPLQYAEKILDACAAPGGKTLILAERIPQARIVACESHELRAVALKKRLSELADSVEVRQMDVTALDPAESFSLALVDAPCSGTGTLGRNPEIRFRLSEEEFLRQAANQEKILRAALATLAPAGKAIYSTCSLESEENAAVVARLVQDGQAKVLSLQPALDRMKELKRITEAGYSKLSSLLSAEGTLQLLPSAGRHDGFFVALLQRA